tara:strand:- start:63 stop:197 length:135 start_codon:yes stop_codon:yes gene_type:complete
MENLVLGMPVQEKHQLVEVAVVLQVLVLVDLHFLEVPVVLVLLL